MCVIVYKPKDVNFPSKETLEKCWKKNDDGAGFMFSYNNKVMIKKGFMTFDDFYKELTKVRETYGDKRPFVMHFRITTQGGVQAKLTHPYPLSKNMEDLRQLNFESDMGVAHNGIISLTTEYGQKDNNDTMKFITDYLSLIIKNRYYYRDKDNIDLISKLCKSKLAILDGKGHVELIGNFIHGEDGCYYSNESFKEPVYVYDTKFSYNTTKPVRSKTNKDNVVYNNVDKALWSTFKRNGKYYFIENHFCPKSENNDCSYCGACAFCGRCGIKGNK